jgi:hypothetical protein
VFFCCSVFSQNKDTHFDIETNFLRGNILAHTDKLGHLITGHPEGIMLSFSKKTNGNQNWQKLFNYPEYGVYFLHQDFKNEFLGKNYALGVHYNFYFFNRNLQFKIATGIALTTNPYNKVTNSKNNAFGSKIMSNIDLGFAYKKTNVIGNFGFETGVLLAHYSNARIKSPNSGINTLNLNLGVNYSLEEKPIQFKDSTLVNKKITEPLKYNFVFRTGINESSVVNSGQHPFYHIGFFVDKRINTKSALQLGSDLFLSQYLKDYIKYQAVAYPEENINPNSDYKRVGIFIGHELFINKISFETQIGYYVYQPNKFDLPIYDRLGIKYHINKKVFTGLSLKTHLFLAEALEVFVGIRI